MTNNINVRASQLFRKMVKEKAHKNGLTVSRLIRIAVSRISDEDILEAMMIEAGYKKPQ